MKNNTTTIEYIEDLHKKGILPGPDGCTCGNKYLKIQKLSSKKYNFCFRCTKKKCKLYYPIRKKSFFENFTHLKIEDVMEVIKCNLCFKYNITRAEKYLKEEKLININKCTIRKIYKKIRKSIYEYYLLQYATDIFAEENTWEYFATDESLFTHIKGKQIWVLNIINTATKEFRIMVTLNRDTANLKKFITYFVPAGNNIITDKWSAYNFLNELGYRRVEHDHGRHDWGYGYESTSHSENIWNVLQSEIKQTYRSIQNKDFFYILREAEFKYKNRNRSNIEIINEFFDCYNLVFDFDSYGIEKDPDFLYYEDLEALFDDSSDDDSD